MKKRFFLMLLALSVLLTFTVSISAIAVSAEEFPNQEVETVTEEVETGKLSELIAKVNELKSEDSFFNKVIVPILTGAGVSILGLLAVLIPYIRKNAAYNKVYGICAVLQTENQTLNTLLTSTDITKIKDALSSLFGEELNEKLSAIAEKIKPSEKIYTELMMNIKILIETVNSLKQGALNAWAESPQAVACLTETPTKEVLLSAERVIEILKGYVREQKGEEAEKVLKDLGV